MACPGDAARRTGHSICLFAARNRLSGEIDFVYDYSASNRYALSFRNLSTEDASEYVDALKAAGFAEITAEANDASAGTMLQKGDTTLSIAYSQGAMIVLIALNG